MIYTPANERLLLGSVLLLGSIPIRVQLVSGDFSDPRNAAVWESMCAIVGRSEALDVYTIEAELEATGKLLLVGGLGELCEIVRNGGTHTIEHYARVVREFALRRALVRKLRFMLDDAENLRELPKAMIAVQAAYNALDDAKR